MSELEEIYTSLSKLYDCSKYTHGFICNCDARDGIRHVKSNTVDTVITDPPWGIQYDEFDDPNVFYELEGELYRAAKKDSWLVVYYSVRDLPKAFELKHYEYVWLIPYLFLSTGSTSRNRLGSQQAYGAILVFKKGSPRIRTYRKDVIFVDEPPLVAGKIKEPLFKPLSTVTALLAMFTSQGDIVFDPFAGYGSIPLMCEVYGRRWLAFEIDPLKYRVARRIIEMRQVYNIEELKKSVSLN